MVRDHQNRAKYAYHSGQAQGVGSKEDTEDERRDAIKPNLNPSPNPDPDPNPNPNPNPNTNRTRNRNPNPNPDP